MFIVNDIDLLRALGRHKILDFILSKCKVAISTVRLREYSLIARRDIEQYSGLEQIDVDEKFPEWTIRNRKYLSMGDLSSVYISMVRTESSLVISEEDIFIEDVAARYNVGTIRFDEFVISNIRDEKLIQLYHLIKVA